MILIGFSIQNSPIICFSLWFHTHSVWFLFVHQAQISLSTGSRKTLAVLSVARLSTNVTGGWFGGYVSSATRQRQAAVVVLFGDEWRSGTAVLTRGTERRTQSRGKTKARRSSRRRDSSAGGMGGNQGGAVGELQRRFGRRWQRTHTRGGEETRGEEWRGVKRRGEDWADGRVTTLEKIIGLHAHDGWQLVSLHELENGKVDVKKTAATKFL